MPVVPFTDTKASGRSPIMDGPAPSKDNLLLAAAMHGPMAQSTDKIPEPKKKKGAPSGPKIIR